MVASTPNYREAGELLCAYGVRLGMEGDDAGAQQALASAMAIAKHEGDLTLEMVTLISSAWGDLHYLRLHESDEKSLRAIELMEQLDDPLRGWHALFQVSRLHYNRGNLGESQRYATRLLPLVEGLGDTYALAHTLYLSGKIAMLAGDWSRARQLCERGLPLAPQHQGLWQVRTQLEYEIGEFAQGATFLERLIEVYRAQGPEPWWIHVVVPHTIAVDARMTGTTKHFDAAHAAAQIILKSQRVCPVWVCLARTGLALIAAQIGDTTTVQEHYRALRGQHGDHLTMDGDHILGILATAIDDLDQAAKHFEAALVTWGNGRYPPYAWTAYEYAGMLLQRGNSGDQARANSLLDDALSISRELGIAPLTERVLLRKESVNPP
jgi:tetratricopeptide (TPR) repeat protein